MKNFLVFTLILSVFIPSILKAETNTEPISCFDYYKFGSVYATLETKNSVNVSGTKINFFGEIKNDNNYPIVDGKLFVKIMKQNDSYAKTGGQDEVDSFIVKEGISIPASSSMPISFDWQIPAYAISGEYQVSTYFIIDDSFNMSGLSFTTDIVGSVVKFEIAGSVPQSVYFDRAQIKLNDKPYHTVAFTPSIFATSTANISLTLSNNTNEMQRVPVTLELYEWDSQSKKNFLNSKETTYLLKPKSSIQIPYQITDTQHSVYFLVAKALYEDAKSEVSVRFGRSRKEEPRINFSTFASYPFEKGKENSLVTCVHNTNGIDAEYGKVVTTVLDHKGKPIHTSTYEGKITSAMQGMISKFVPNAEYKDLVINTKIYDKDNTIIDETSVDYKCSDLSNSCEEPNLLLNLKTLVTAVSLIILLILILLIKKYTKKKDFIVCLTIMFALSAVLVPRVTRAGDEIDWSYTHAKLLATPASLFADVGGSNWVTTPPTLWILGQVNMSVDYHVSVFDHDSGLKINENADVQPGQILDFVFGPFGKTDISWSAVGGTWGTPFGFWVPNAENSMKTEFNKEFEGFVYDSWWAPSNIAFANKLEQFFLDFGITPYLEDSSDSILSQFSVNPPNVKIESSSSDLSCGEYVRENNADSYTIKTTCTVLSASTTQKIIEPKFIFENTFAKMYAVYPSHIGGNISCVYSNQWGCVQQRMTNLDLCPPFPYNPGTNPKSLDTCSTSNYYYGYPYVYSNGTLEGPQVVFDIATTTIPFPLTIQPSSTCTSNSTSTISSFNITPNPAMVGQTSTFTFTATDSDVGQTITYQMEYDGTPVSVSSGFTKTWASSDIGEHIVKIRAYDGCAYSPWSTQTVTVNSQPTLPQTNITLVGSCTANAPKITVTWDLVAGATGYEVFRDGSSIITLNDSSIRTYPDDDISKDTDYIYIVRAFNSSNGTESYSIQKTTKATCLTCDTTHNVGDPGEEKGLPAPCSMWQCNLTTWEDVPYFCQDPVIPNDPTAHFYFKPNIVNPINQCPLYLNSVNAVSCTTDNGEGLIESIATSSIGNISKPVGKYSVSCLSSDGSVVYTKSDTCYPNPEFREN